MNNGFYEFSRGKQETTTTSSVFPYTGSAIISGSLTVTGSISATQGFTGSLFGTSSWATNSITSSYITSSNVYGPFGANSVLSASYALTSSFAISSSFATTSSFAVSASWAPTQTINTGSFATTGSNIFTGNQTITGSLAIINTTPRVTLRNSGSGASGQIVILAIDDTFTNKTAGTSVFAMNVLDAGESIKGGIVYTKASNSATNTSINYNSSANTAIYISGSGDVGIRTTTPTSASLHVNGNVWANSFTGSLFGTASWATNAITASYVNTLNQNIQISGSLKLDPTQDPDPTGLDLDSTVLFQSSSNSALGYDLYFRQNGNLVKWKWIEGSLETGLLYGGVVTYSGSNVYISPGSGIIAEHNATTSSEVSPMIEYVTWNAITQSVSNIATQQVTYLYIDNNGSLQQQSTRFTSQQYHSYIPLGAVGHFDYTQVSAFGGGVQTAYDQGSQTSNFIDAFGPLKVSGYGLTGQANSLRLSVGSGTSFIHGGFYQNDPEFPSQITTPSQATASLARINRSGSVIEFDTNAGNFYTVVDPTKYDRDGDGTLANVGSGNWTIQRVFSDPKTGVLYVYYGQARYTSLLNALQFLPTDPFTEGDTFDFTTFVGFLVLKGNTTDITDTADNSIINGGLFRGSGQGSGGGIALSNLEDLTDVSITSPTNGQALIYDSGIWQNGNPISASFSSTASLAQGGNGSFSGSFSGSGENLNSIPASAITGLNLSQLATGSVTASVSPTQFTVSSASINEFTVTGTGVTLGSAITDTHRVTGSLNVTGSAIISGNTVVTGSFTSTATTLLNTLSGNTAIGLSTDTSTARLQVRGTGATSATNTLLLQNSSLTNLLTVRDDGSSTLIGRLNITPTASTTSSLVVTGPTLLSGSQNTISGSVLTVVGSGSAQAVFTVQGSQGELFSVVDSLSGSLFSVNDISGLPIIEVFSDGTTLIGDYLDPMLITTKKLTLTNSGSFTIYSLPTASYDTAFFDYSVRSGSNARAGQIMAIQSGSSVNYTEVTTTDFGTTTGLALGVFVSGSNMVLTGSAATTAWTIKTIVRSI
jgi:hypothetical protein